MKKQKLLCVSTSEDGCLRVWDALNSEMIQKVAFGAPMRRVVAVFPSLTHGSHLLVVGDNGAHFRVLSH